MHEIQEEFRERLAEELPWLRRLSLVMARDRTRAEDLLGATIVKALESEATFSPETHLRSWLTTVMRSVMYASHRRRRESEDPDGSMEAALTAADNPLEALIAKEDISFLVNLPEKYVRAAVMMAKGYELSEMALEESIPEGTCKSRISRMRTRLREMTE